MKMVFIRQIKNGKNNSCKILQTQTLTTACKKQRTNQPLSTSTAPGFPKDKTLNDTCTKETNNLHCSSVLNCRYSIFRKETPVLTRVSLFEFLSQRKKRQKRERSGTTPARLLKTVVCQSCRTFRFKMGKLVRIRQQVTACT